MTPCSSPRLLADIGGTCARFALERAPDSFEHQSSLRCADHADFFAAVTAHLKGLPPGPDVHIEHAAVAIANPVEGDDVRMTNYHWQFSIEQMRNQLGLATLVVVNDFTALGMALPRLAPSGRRQVGGGVPRERSVVGLLGAGTGLGASAMPTFRSRGCSRALASNSSTKRCSSGPSCRPRRARASRPRRSRSAGCPAPKNSACRR